KLPQRGRRLLALPEFAMLEAYQAYADYNTMATLTRELVQEAAEAVFGGTVVRHADGSEHDLGGPCGGTPPGRPGFAAPRCGGDGARPPGPAVRPGQGRGVLRVVPHERRLRQPRDDQRLEELFDDLAVRPIVINADAVLAGQPTPPRGRPHREVGLYVGGVEL